MFLEFPNLDALQLALTSGAMPAAIAGAAAEVGVADDGRVFVAIAGIFRRKEAARLKELGVAGRKKSPVDMQRAVSCWPEILPLRREESPFAPTEKTPVLFDLPDDGTLADVVNEMLRLGNDRQSFRRIVADAASVAPEAGSFRHDTDAGSVRHGMESRVLLRVVGPPYYSLLRALDCETGNGAPRAFVERHAGVWVEAGYVHPLAEYLQPPPGKLLLLRPPHDWTQLDEAPFRDVYEVLEFDVPDIPGNSENPWDVTDAELRLQVPLRLVRGGSADVAELWVLEDDAVERLEAFVQSAADHLLGRLAFAVGEAGGRTTVVLRLRPGRQPAPVLVLDAAARDGCAAAHASSAAAYCSYLKIPNLFLPAGRRLHPPLRRDVVKKLLADDANQITWLAPGEDGLFQPRSLPDAAFRPLADWVDYVLDQHHEALEAWVQSTRFNFEPFICADDKPDKPKPRPQTAKSGTEPRGQKGKPDASTSPQKAGVVEKLTRKFQKGRRKGSAAKPQPAVRKPSELERNLRELEESFLKLDSPLDAPERRELWREMARTHAALEHADDAGLCWTHVVWDDEAPDVDDYEEWFEAAGAGWPGLEADRVVDALTHPDPPPAMIRAVAAWVVWCEAAAKKGSGTFCRNGPSGASHKRFLTPFSPPPFSPPSQMPALRQFLERNEASLPIRTAWLAWLAFSRLSGHDALSLARARDRLLERLFQHGLIPEHDLPGFLRVAGLRSGDRFQHVCQEVVELRDTVQEWGDKFRSSKSAGTPTPAYIDLIFAFGFARLGETNRSKELLNSAGAALKGKPIHDWLFAAFEHRIGQVLNGRRSRGDTLPRELLEAADAMDRNDRLKIDYVRRRSQILEPHERINPYDRLFAKYADELTSTLNRLSAMHDRAALAKRLGELLSEPRPEAERIRILATALELAPRLGEAVAERILQYAGPLLDRLESPKDEAMLLEKGMLLAANYDRRDDVQDFVERTHRLLLRRKGAGPAVIEPLESLLAESMRGMRKLGMRDHMSRLLATMDGIVEKLQQQQVAKRAGDKTSVDLLKLRLQIAAGWFFFGNDASAWPIVDAVREILFRKELSRLEHTKLACAYLTTLGQSPVEQALERFRELFAELRGVEDEFITAGHFALSQLQVVEALILAIANDDFTPDKAGRKWMDDDEFLIRRRIHRDVRAALGNV